MKLHGIPEASGICVDCGSRPARHRDHRHYSSPLKVAYVCAQCNALRGQALDLHDLIRRHRGLDKSIPDSAPLPQEPEVPLYELPTILDNIIRDAEIAYIREALKKTGGNMFQAAKLLGINYRSMRYRMKARGIK